MNAKPVKLIGLLSMLAGLIMLIAGATTWAVVTSQLKSENITVPADASSNAGKQVGGPFTAWSQAEIIKEHALHGAENKTYAELGGEIKKAEAAGDKAAVEKWTAARTSAMNGSFLRASLFTSIVSYGVSALVMGLGLLSALVGWALTRIAKMLDAARDRIGTDHVRTDRVPADRVATDRTVSRADAERFDVSKADGQRTDNLRNDGGATATDRA